MAWIVLILAGLMETAWATGLKLITEKSSPLLIGLTGLTMLGSFLGLYWAMARLPLGVAYPVWTSIGAVGTVIVGAIYFGTNLSLVNIFGIGFIVLGMFMLGNASH
jgi:quaternary ammonium compound-resistance protein SugE